MTLDCELDIPEYTVKLYYHSSRRPSEEMVKKICESLQLAREISEETAEAVAEVLNDAKKDDPLARQVAEYHFKVNADCPKNVRDKVIDVLSKTAEGLKNSTTLSDVLSRYRWDLYKLYQGRARDEVREELSGVFREFESKEKNRPAEEGARSGYLPFTERLMEADSGAQFSPDGQRVVTVSEKERAQVWDAVTGDAIGEPMIAPEAVRSAWFSPDGRWVVTTSRAGTTRVWDVATGEGIGKPMQHEGEVYSAQFSSDGQRVLTASADKTARVWKVETGEAVGEPMPHEGEVYSARFSPDGQRVVTASSDGSVRVWNAETGEEIGEPMPHGGEVYSVQFSPDGLRVVSASADKTARVWNVETRRAIGEVMRHEDRVRSAQFSPDGQRVVTASDDETARIWNAMTGEAVFRLQHDELVYSARFSSEGKKVVTVTEFRKQQVWNAVTGELLSERAGPEWLREAKGIHIEFSAAEIYPWYFLALCIVHEATHKFARTEDHAYTDDDDQKYEKLNVEKRIENADSFAYATISIALEKLIKDLREFLKEVPQNDPTGPGKASPWPNGVLSRAKARGISSGTG